MPSVSRPPRADAAVLTVASARASDRGLDPGLDPFVGGGEMAELMRSVDWSATAVGPVSAWPQSLRTALSIINASGYPMYLAWGPDFVQFYNDAFRPILGVTKHPAAMGGSTRMTFAEIWDAIRPLFEQVLDDGEQTYLEDALFPLDRNGFLEECYFTFSYSAIRDETGRPGGVLVTCLETTGRVLGERRLRLLGDLSSDTPGVLPAEAAARAAAVLATEPRDLPFALVYLLDEDGETLALAGAAGLAAGGLLAPSTIRSRDRERVPWPLARVMALRSPVIAEGLAPGELENAAWPEPVERALVLPIARPNQEQLAGVLVAGLSPRLPFDDGYRGFLDLVAGQVATAIADARAYDEERRRAEALAELDRAKTAFFSDVSHEFRTPLTLLLGPLEEALAATSTLDPATRTELKVAHRAALRLLKLVNTLLDFSRIEAGRMEAVVEPTDLAAFTADLASVFRSAVERAGLELVVDCPPLPDLVHVDRDMWEKIVLNLLSNALKFTFDGRITVRLAGVDGAAELVVEDTGIGIEPEESGRIFERFHRVRGAAARSHEGTGIGLALVQELVRLLGGSISVRSTPGAGTAFTVRVPHGPVHPAADRAAGRTLASTAIAAAVYTEEALRWLPGGPEEEPWPGVGDGRAAPRRRDARGGQPARRPNDAARILLADDNADMREYVARLLGSRWSIETVGDGRTALDRALANPPDLVLADVMMPGLDGFELLDALRAEPRTSGVPVVLLSARAGEESRIEGLERGADDYITKPFSARELVARLEAHLQLADHRRQAAAGERERAVRADRLAAATIAINAAASLTDMLEVTTRETRLAIGAHLAVASLTMDRSWRQAINAVSTSDRYARWRDYDTVPVGSGIHALVCETNQPVRLTQAELEAHPRWSGLGGDAGHPPMRGWLAAPLVGRDGRNLGVIQLSDREEGDFTAEDEALLVQVAQVASIALERMQLDAARIERERQQAAVAQFGQQALSGMPVQELLDEACRVVRDTLGVELVKVLQLLPGGAELRLAAGVGWQPGLVGTAVVGAGLDSQAGYTLSVGEPVIVADMADEPRFSGPALLRDHDVVSGMSVVIAGEAQPFGVLGAHTTSRRTFNAHDVDFLRTVANVVAAAVERHGSEDRLAALALAERLRAGELRAVLDAMDEGIVVVDALGRVLLRNAAADALLGVAVVSFDAVRDAFDWSPDAPPPELTDATPVERPLRHAHGRWGELRAHPVPDPSATVAGAALGTILVVRDVTEERNARTLRDAFIGVLSHELRTPITTIYAGSKLLARTEAGSSEAEAGDTDGTPTGPAGAARGPLVADIAAEADRLYRLVEDLLVLAKFERGATEILGEPVLLQRVLPTVVRSEAARWPGARFEIDLAPDLPAVRADPTYAEQIARNLLANAAKYSEPGSPIELSAREVDGEVVVRVCDEGSGFVADEADRLFELFYRSPTVSRKPGAGIGLFVARRLVESMGGRIWAKPRSPRGAEFGFVLRVHTEEDS